MILLNLFIHISYCTIVGIDLGSDSIKVAVGSRSKPVHLVRNLYSNEATPNIFAYHDKSHWAFGEGAIDQCYIHPESCIRNQRIPLNDKLYFTTNPLKGYQIVALSLIQILTNVKNTEKIVDDMKVVIAIPPSMTNREKSYLYSALTIIGVNCIQFVTSTYAPIEVYVNEQKYRPNLDNTAVFVDIGHEGVRVSGFEFDNSRIVQKFGQYNDNVGGKTIDNNLLNYVVNKYKLKLSSQEHNDLDDYKNDLKYQKNRIKLLSEIRKAREQLTVNQKVSFEFKSKQITLNRNDIDNCCNEIKQSLNQMIRSLKENYQDLLRSGSIQLLGGCSRIPCLQEYIKQLIPGVRQLRTMDTISSVCMGACYLISSEIQTNIQIHDALVTTKVILKYNSLVYKLFSYGNTENFNPVVRLNNVEPNQKFRIIDVNDNEQEFTRFSINILSNNGNYFNTIDLGFTLNYYLMPVPDQPMLIQQYGNQIPLSINYEKIGWEVSPDELAKSKEIIDSMVSRINQRLRVEKDVNLIDEYKIYVESNLENNGYGLLNWKKAAYSGICYYIDSLYNSCLDENGGECPSQKLNSILDKFKSLASSTLKIDNDDNDNDDHDDDHNYHQKSQTKTERQEAIDELYSLIEACKLAGTKYDDVEYWVKTKLNSASMKEIYEYIGILKERGKKAQESYYTNL